MIWCFLMHPSKVLYLFPESQVGKCLVTDQPAVWLQAKTQPFHPTVLCARVGLKTGLNFKRAFSLHNL